MPMFLSCGSGVILGIYLNLSVFIRLRRDLKSKKRGIYHRCPVGQAVVRAPRIGEGPPPRRWAIACKLSWAAFAPVLLTRYQR